MAISKIENASLASGSTTPSVLSTGAPSWNSSGVFSFNSGYGSVATAYGCRAWVNFNGTGTIAIRGSGNVSSITDYGTGDYGINMTVSMPDVNYSVVASFKYDTSLPTPTNQFDQSINTYALTTSVATVYMGYQNSGGSGPIDAVQTHVAIFR